MSAASLFQRTGGLLTETDHIRLAWGLRVRRGHLTDSATGDRYQLHHRAVPLLRQLQAGCRAGEWAAELADAELLQLISFLNTIGGLAVTRPRLQAAATPLRRLARRLQRQAVLTPTRRRPAKLPDITKLSARALLPFVIIMPLEIVLATGIGVSLLSASLTAAAVIGVLWTSMVAHESAHVRFVGAPAAVLQRRWNIGILHRPLRRRRDILTALIGPAAGAAVCLAAGVLAALWDLSFIVTLCCLGCAMHLASLLPGSGDGNSLIHRQKAAQ